MNTGFWIFATAVLVLIVLHKGFRRFAAWAGLVGVVVAIIGGGWWIYAQRAKNSRAETAAEFGPSTSTPSEQSSATKLPDDIAWTPIDIDCGSGQYVATDADGQLQCMPETTVAPNGKLYCSNDTQGVQDPATKGWSCYNRRDPVQLRHHLKECAPQKVVPVHPRNDGHDLTSIRAMADKRGALCNVFDQFDQPKAQP